MQTFPVPALAVARARQLVTEERAAMTAWQDARIKRDQFIDGVTLAAVPDPSIDPDRLDLNLDIGVVEVSDEPVADPE